MPSILFVLGLAFAFLASHGGDDPKAAPPTAEHAGTRATVQDLVWSPDGQRLYFSAMRVKTDYSDYSPAKWAVYRLDLASREVRRLVPQALHVALDPKGTRLAVGRLFDGQRDIQIVDLDGRELARLTTDPADDFAATWSPDGKRIAFNSRRAGKEEIFVVAASGGEAVRLTHSDGASAYNPAWSPDGSRIVYYLEKGDHRDQIHVVGPDGTEDVDLTSDEGNNIFPGWTPAGRVIYSRGGKEGPTRVYTVAADGSGKQPLGSLEAYYARFSPDGARIAGVRERQESIFLFSSDGRLLDTFGLDGVE